MADVTVELQELEPGMLYGGKPGDVRAKIKGSLLVASEGTFAECKLKITRVDQVNPGNVPCVGAMPTAR